MFWIGEETCATGSMDFPTYLLHMHFVKEHRYHYVYGASEVPLWSTRRPPSLKCVRMLQGKMDLAWQQYGH